MYRNQSSRNDHQSQRCKLKHYKIEDYFFNDKEDCDSSCQKVFQNPLIVKNVFSHLNAKELYPLRLVNQLWNSISFKFIIAELEKRRLILGSENEIEEWNSLFKKSSRIIHRNFKISSKKCFQLETKIKFFNLSGPTMKFLDLSNCFVVKESNCAIEKASNVVQLPINFLREILLTFCPNLYSLKIGSNFERQELNGLFKADDKKLVKLGKLSIGHVFSLEKELLRATPNLKSLSFDIHSQDHRNYNIDTSKECFISLRNSLLLSKVVNLEMRVFDQIIADQITYSLDGQKMSNLKNLKIKAICPGESKVEPYNYFWDFMARHGISESLEFLKIGVSGFKKVNDAENLWYEVQTDREDELGFRIPFTFRQFTKLKKLSIDDRCGSTISRKGFFSKKSIENIPTILPNLEKVLLNNMPEINLTRYATITSFPEVYSVKSLCISDVLYDFKFLLSLDSIFPNLENLRIHFSDYFIEEEDYTQHTKRQQKALKTLWSLWPKMKSLTIQLDSEIIDLDTIISGIDEERFHVVKTQMERKEKILYDGSSLRYMQNLEKLDLIFPNIELNSASQKNKSVYLTDFSAKIAFSIHPKFKELKVYVESNIRNFNFSKISNAYCKAVKVQEESKNVEFSRTDIRSFVVKTHYFN